MNPNKELAKLLVKSLREEPGEWVFNSFSANNSKSGISIRHYGYGLFDASVISPQDVTFSLIDRIRIVAAMNRCRAYLVLKIIKGEEK